MSLYAVALACTLTCLLVEALDWIELRQGSLKETIVFVVFGVFLGASATFGELHWTAAVPFVAVIASSGLRRFLVSEGYLTVTFDGGLDRPTDE